MACRPSPEEEAWAAEYAVKEQTHRAGVCDRQRAITVDLLQRLLATTGLPPEFVQTVQACVFSAPSTPVAGVGDESANALRLLRDAEVHLCVARHALLQIVPFLPVESVAPFAARIAIERSAHLAHRQEDCAAELATVERRINDLAQSTSGAAELAWLRSEAERLRGLDAQQLLANRDFTGPTCAKCGLPMPMLPGLDAAKLAIIVKTFAKGKDMKAIKLVREATGLGLNEAWAYTFCPHGPKKPAHVESLVQRNDMLAARCHLCGTFLPLTAKITPALADSLVEHSIANRRFDAVKALGDATGWGLKAVDGYLRCPHRLP